MSMSTYLQPKTLIRDRRKQLGMTLRRVADAVGTTPQTIQRLETGNMTISMEWLCKIAEALETHPAKLLTPAETSIAENRFAEQAVDALIRSRRHVPDICDVPMELFVAAGKLAEFWLDYAKGLRGFEGIPAAAANVAGLAMRIDIDGEKLRAEKAIPKLVAGAA
jgi:transcriptional regulator with XRE-family HTH domain